MGSFSTLGGGVITKLSELIDPQRFKTDIATIATALNEMSDADATSYCRAFSSGFIASVFDNTNITVAKAASIIENLTDDTKAYDILLNMLSASKRAEILNEIIKTKTPTLSGSWETSPSNLGNIVDGNSTTSTTEGSVYTEYPTTSKDGYINIDLGRKYPVDAIYAKWSGAQEGSGDCYYSCHNYLEKSLDGETYDTLIDALSQDGSISVAADVRYLRIKTHAGCCSSSGCWRRTKITVYLIKFTT